MCPDYPQLSLTGCSKWSWSQMNPSKDSLEWITDSPQYGRCKKNILTTVTNSLFHEAPVGVFVVKGYSDPTFPRSSIASVKVVLKMTTEVYHLP